MRTAPCREKTLFAIEIIEQEASASRTEETVLPLEIIEQEATQPFIDKVSFVSERIEQDDGLPIEFGIEIIRLLWRIITKISYVMEKMIIDSKIHLRISL